MCFISRQTSVLNPTLCMENVVVYSACILTGKPNLWQQFKTFFVLPFFFTAEWHQNWERFYEFCTFTFVWFHVWFDYRLKIQYSKQKFLYSVIIKLYIKTSGYPTSATSLCLLIKTCYSESAWHFSRCSSCMMVWKWQGDWRLQLDGLVMRWPAHIFVVN